MSIITTNRAVEVHDTIIKETGGANGVLSISLLEACVDRLEIYIFHYDPYPDIFQKAAALMHCIILLHPFVDGNKRSGIVLAGIFLENNGYSLQYSVSEAVNFTVQIAMGKCEINEITEWLLNHSIFTPPE